MRLVAINVFAGSCNSLVNMPPKRGRKRPHPARTPEADAALHQKLSQCGTKTGLVSALSALRDAGWLARDVVLGSESTVKHRLRAAQIMLSQMEAPYGKVVRSMSLPLKSLPLWNLAHPVALVDYLSNISANFAEVVMSLSRLGIAMSVLVYIHKICPRTHCREAMEPLKQSIGH